jgi:Immunity protein Imm5
MNSSEILTISSALVSQIADDGELKHPLRRRLHYDIEGLLAMDCWDSYLLLSKSCALKAWPVWRERYSEDLPFATPLAGSTPENPELMLTDDEAELGQLASFLDDIMGEGPEAFPAGSAGLSCWAVNRDHIAQVFLSPPNLSEAEIYPEDWEASLYASMAVAGGPVWEESGDVARRRDFWTWYLMEAVPRCYGRD